MAVTTSARTLSEAAAPKKQASVVPIALIVLGILIAAGAGAYSYFEARRADAVVILVRDIPYGQQITAADLATVEVPRYRPAQLTGIANLAGVIGKFAARDLGANDLVQPGMLLAEPPAEPVYPNGRKLSPNMVPVPFAVSAVGPITDRDRLNLLFIADDDSLCKGLGGSAPIAGGKSFACRFLTDVSILYIDGGTAYLELTPYQAHALWSLQAAGVALVGERYGATSDPLAPLERLEAGQITYEELTAPAPTLTGARAPHVSEAGGQPADSANPATMEPAATPGGTPAEIPGSTLPIPGVQPTAAPAPTDPAAASENGTQP